MPFYSIISELCSIELQLLYAIHLNFKMFLFHSSIAEYINTWCVYFLSSDSRIWQSLPGHEWNHPPVFPPKWRGCPLPHLWRKDLCWHLSLSGGTLQDHQAPQGLLHGCGWSGSKSEDEPAERTKIQVENDGWKKRVMARVTGVFTGICCMFTQHVIFLCFTSQTFM